MHTFHQGIPAMGNTNCIVQDFNSSHRVQFLQRYPLHCLHHKLLLSLMFIKSFVVKYFIPLCLICTCIDLYSNTSNIFIMKRSLYRQYWKRCICSCLIKNPNIRVYGWTKTFTCEQKIYLQFCLLCMEIPLTFLEILSFSRKKYKGRCRFVAQLIM